MVVDGALTNLSNTEIQWTVNQEPAARGRGLQVISINPDPLGDQNIIVKIVVKNFRGRDLEKIVAIPTARPEVGIQRLTSGLFRAWSFFFSSAIDDLIFSWSANGQKTQGQVNEPFLLELVVGDNLSSSLNIQTTVQNRLNPLEIAKGMFIL